MKIYDDLEEMLQRELGAIVKKGDLNATSLENTYKIIDVLKDICEIRCSEDNMGYSGEGYSRGHGYNIMPYSYGMGYEGNSYARGRNSMGRYSRSSIGDKLSMMMDEAQTEKERAAIQKCMETLGY